MRSDGNEALVHGKAAVASGHSHVSLHISGIGRADVDDRPKGTQELLLIGGNPTDRLTGSRVRIAFTVSIIVTQTLSPPFRADLKGVHL